MAKKILSKRFFDMKLLLSFCIFLLSTQVLAQTSFRATPFSSGFGLKGIHTYAGFGFVDFNVQQPTTAFRMDRGIYAFIGGEREINSSGTSVTISFNYMSSEGQSFYNYTTLGGANYTGTDIPFDSTNYQLGLGLRQRLFPHSWFRPYFEGGGLFGYHEISYGTSNINYGTNDPAGIKAKDGLTGFGYYGEAGLEIDFSDTYGIRVGGRYQNSQTRKFVTLADQTLQYEAFVFQMAFMMRF